jgi:hypothetical protein
MRYWRPLAAPVTVASMLRKDRYTLLRAARPVADTLKPLMRPAAGLVIVRADSAFYVAEKSPRSAAAAPICHHRPARPGRGRPIAFIPEEAARRSIPARSLRLSTCNCGSPTPSRGGSQADLDSEALDEPALLRRQRREPAQVTRSRVDHGSQFQQSGLVARCIDQGLRVENVRPVDQRGRHTEGCEVYPVVVEQCCPPMLEQHARLGLVANPVYERDMPQWVLQPSQTFTDASPSRMAADGRQVNRSRPEGH